MKFLYIAVASIALISFNSISPVIPQIITPAWSQESDHSVYDRVQKTNTIRCGYSTWDPLFYIDPKTGEKHGIFHDLMEEAGKRLDIKIVWAEEI